MVFAVLFGPGCHNINNTTMKDNQYPYVIGIISAIESVEIPNKAKGKPSRKEMRITLDISEAYDPEGEAVDINAYDYPSFAGDINRINDYSKGEKVKIICTSATGRHIKEIEKVK